MRKCNLFFVLAFLSVVNVQFQTEPSGLFDIHDSLSWLIYSCLLKDCIILYLSTHSEEERHFGKPWLAQAFHSTHVTLEPNKMRLSGKENVQCYLSYTVVQCFPNPFPGSGSSANHKTTESVQAIRERKFPVYSFLHFPRTMLSKTFHESVRKLTLDSFFPWCIWQA